MAASDVPNGATVSSEETNQVSEEVHASGVRTGDDLDKQIPAQSLIGRAVCAPR